VGSSKRPTLRSVVTRAKTPNWRLRRSVCPIHSNKKKFKISKYNNSCLFSASPSDLVLLHSLIYVTTFLQIVMGLIDRDLNLFGGGLIFRMLSFTSCFYCTSTILCSSKFIPYVERVTLLDTRSGYFYYFPHKQSLYSEKLIQMTRIPSFPCSPPPRTY
jgi:hypothetical protein